MYKLTKGWPVRLSDGAFVSPKNPVYLAWLEAGNVPEPYSPSVEELNAPHIAALAALNSERSCTLAEIVLAQLAGEPIPLYAKAKLADIELQAAKLRECLKW